VAASKPGPFQEFYNALLRKGMRAEMARLTLARKIATIVLIVWKTRSVLRPPTSETTNSMSVSDRIRSISGKFLWRWPLGSRDTLVRERVSAGTLGGLSRDPSPSRITRKSYGPRVPNRTRVANLTTFCFVGFGTARLRRQDATKTAGKENPNRCAITWRQSELLGRLLQASLLTDVYLRFSFCLVRMNALPEEQ
jgi:hypothetical protein